MNLSFVEIFVLALIGLLVFGPERLPDIARNAGKVLRSFQRESQGAMDELRRATDVDLGLKDLGTMDLGIEDPGAKADLPKAPPAPGAQAAPALEPAPVPAAAEPSPARPQPPAARPAASNGDPRIFEDT